MRQVSRRSEAVLTGALAVLTACATARRPFSDRPVAWHEHDAEPLPAPPKPSDLGDLDAALLYRDAIAYDVDRVLAAEGPRPARDVNSLDEVPCSTWFCPRHHLRRLSRDELVAGPPGYQAPTLPLSIDRGKDKGGSLGVRVRDAEGRKYLVKCDPAGHLGMLTGAEIIGTRLFHAAGYHVPGSWIVDARDDQLQLAKNATFLLDGVAPRPLDQARVRRLLDRCARLPDGRLRLVAIAWVPGRILGAFDMLGRRADDPNDRIEHEDRRSLRASLVPFAWLNVFDASALNTLDSYDEDGKFVRHHFIDFGAGLGSMSWRPKGPHEHEERALEVGRSLAALGSLGVYRRTWQDLREEWQEASLPSVGYLPVETFDPDRFRTFRKVPAHMRMTERDGYWGAKVVTSFTDDDLAAIVAEAQLPVDAAAFVLHALRVRRDRVGARWLRAVTAVERPRLEARAGGAALCFDDLAIARGAATPREISYAASVDGAPARRVLPTSDRTCAPVALADGRYVVVTVRSEVSGRPARAAHLHLGWRAAERRHVVVGLERDE